MKTWFITGTSRGFGREWAIAALDRGDKVAATARDLGTLDDLVTSSVTRSSRSSWTSPTGRRRSPPSSRPTSGSGGWTDWSGSSAQHATPLPVYDPGNPPLRLFLGESPLRIAVEDYGSRLATWAQWQQVAAAAQGTPG